MGKRIISSIIYPDKDLFDPDKHVLNVGISVQKWVDDCLLETLYRLYEESDIASLYVIDEGEFERFLKKYLPIWKKEGNACDEED